jgi:hypothetical protein
MAHFGPKTVVLDVFAYQVQDPGARIFGRYPLNFVVTRRRCVGGLLWGKSEELLWFQSANYDASLDIFREPNDYGVSRASAPVSPGEISYPYSQAPALKLLVLT